MKDIEKYKDQFYTVISARIKDLRKEKGIKQEILAKELKMARTTLINIEKAHQHVPLFMMYVIADHLNVDIKDLLPSMDEFKKIVYSEEHAPEIKGIDISEAYGAEILGDRDINTIANFIKKYNKSSDDTIQS